MGLLEIGAVLLLVNSMKDKSAPTSGTAPTTETKTQPQVSYKGNDPVVADWVSAVNALGGAITAVANAVTKSGK